MTRQYIGARYVTKVYENSQDAGSAEWESGVEYEPLTLVTYLNSSYLSKKTVPVTVGNPAENTAYWVRTGYYNGQIEFLDNKIDNVNDALQGEIDDINGELPGINTKLDNKVDDYSARKFLFISDSYDNIPRDTNRTMSDLCAGYGGWNYLKISRGGYGFAGKRNDQKWIDLLPAVPDKDTFTDIVVYGGLNDAPATENELQTAIDEFDTYIRNNFPNVKRIYGGFSGWFYKKKDSRGQCYDTWRRYLKMMPAKGWLYLNGFEYVSRDPSLFGNTGIDPSHPVESSIPIFAKALYEAITTGSCTYSNAYVIPVTFNSSYFSGTLTHNLVVVINNGTCTVSMTRKYLSCSANIPTTGIEYIQSASPTGITIPFPYYSHCDTSFAIGAGNDDTLKMGDISQPDLEGENDFSSLTFAPIVEHTANSIFFAPLYYTFSL